MSARSIAAHLADSALIDFGWDLRGQPEQRSPKRTVATGGEMLYAPLHRDYGALLFAVNNALHTVRGKMRTSQFDDATFRGVLRP